MNLKFFAPGELFDFNETVLLDSNEGPVKVENLLSKVNV